MDREKLIQKYYNVSRDELDKIWRTTHFCGLSESTFERGLRILHDKRENVKVNGKDSLIVGPLVYVVSAEFLPSQINPSESLSAYGRIYSECCDSFSGKKIVHDIYNHMFDDAKILGPSDSLTLSNSVDMSWSCMPFHNTRFVVDVCVGSKTLGYASCVGNISCSEDLNDLECEHVKLSYFHNELGVLTIRHIAIPFGVCALVRVRFFHKQEVELDGKNSSFLNVKGRVVARYGNTYGDRDLGKCTLFEKELNDYQRVRFDSRGRSLRLDRNWVCLPVHSSLILDMDLSEFGSESKILKETLEFRVQNKVTSSAEIIVDGILISVGVVWFSPEPHGSYNDIEEKYSDDEISLEGSIKEDTNDDEQMKESCGQEASSNLTRPWQGGLHRHVPIPRASLQIFSILISRENLGPLQVYGSVEVFSLESKIYFHKDATNAFGLVQGRKTLPVLDNSFIYDDCESLKIKVDLKDVKGCLNIKGFVDWDSRSLEFGTQWLNQQLCSFIEGEYGFAAIHYSIFPEAVQGNVSVLCVPKNVTGYHNILPKVYGTIYAEYNNFDYTSQYNKDYYRIVLFQRTHEDSVDTSENGLLWLSRSMVVVPSTSSLILEVNLWMGAEQVLWHSSLEFEVGVKEKSLENNDYSFRFFVKWGEVGEHS